MFFLRDGKVTGRENFILENSAYEDDSV
ncbi:hypothetical protein Q604_UNBC16257G0001, partial [human gut metagenome]